MFGHLFVTLLQKNLLYPKKKSPRTIHLLNLAKKRVAAVVVFDFFSVFFLLVCVVYIAKSVLASDRLHTLRYAHKVTHRGYLILQVFVNLFV